MEPLKESVEKASGDAFIKWINASNNENYKYKGRAGEAPDLVYSNEVNELRIEHTGAYYDQGFAKFIWDGIRKPERDIQGPCIVENPDESLKEAIIKQIEKKSEKDYGKNCVLLIALTPVGTGERELENLLFPLPKINGMDRFKGVYIAGNFPIIDGVGGGYHVIVIKEICS